MKRYRHQCVAALLMLFSFCTTFQSFGQTNLVPDDQEFQVLKALYDSLDGPNWTNKTNWPTPGNWPATATAAQMGTWFGITVLNGDISKVILPGNNLTGKVPTAIGQITQVSQIQLHGNKLNGTLPSSLGSLSKLVWLRFDINKLTGTIPASLGNLPLIQHLYLGGNLFTGSVPPALGNLSSLLILSLSDNQLTGPIPSSFGGLQNLTDLYLHNNQLSGSIPGSLGNLTNLVNLYLRNNQLTGTLPASLGNLTKLKALYLNVNALSGSIPASLGNLLDLEYLHLQQNQLTGSIPPQLGSLSKLLQLYINLNKLSGDLPSDLGNLTKLQYFNAQSNQLTGTIPSSFSGMTSLVLFYVSHNQLSGTLPEIFGSMTKLTSLELTANQFAGAFPSTIGNCLLLMYLRCDSNKFTSIPASVLSFTALNYLNFDGNELGSIPGFSGHSNKANLSLWLRNNRLDFSQLEPLIDAGLASVTCNPQKAINDVPSAFLKEGEALVLTARPTGQFSAVTWEKQNPNGTWTALANDQDSNLQTYTRTTAALTDEGAYRWRMTNTKVTPLTLQSEAIAVKTPMRFVLDDLAFQYQYDGRRRMTHKKVPGADWVYMVYDDRDRLVMTQDGEQRKTNKWSFTKYDALNRPVMTGIYTHSGFVDQAGMNALIDTTDFYETYNGIAATHGYTNVVFPTATASMEILTVSYYDDYSFKNLINDPAFDYLAGDLSCATVNSVSYCQEPAAFGRTTGQVTGSKTKVLGQPVYLWQATYYDQKYRPVQTIAHNNQLGLDRQTSIVDFTGKILKTKTTHSVPGRDLVTITRKFEYDHAGRLLKTWHNVDEADPVLLAQNEYNEIGQLVTKNLYNADPASTPDASRTFKQQLDYRYNIRGWLTRINNSDVSIMENGPRDYFGMNLFYNEGGTELVAYQPQFNGNISAMKWSTNLGLGASIPGVPTENAYAFRYDTLNRLTSTAFHTKPSAGWTASTAYNEGNLKYDLNGNIKTLNRSTTAGAAMDQLSYTYHGNQLLKVSDASDKKKGFVDAPSPDNDYAYDANGNMRLDLNKDITSITYNHLNLPDKVTKRTGEYITYAYDATGRKLSQGVYNASHVLQKKTDYAGELFYENDTLKFINHEEGRVVMTGSVPEYQYHLKDHLGNVRMTFTTKQEAEIATATMETASMATEYSQFLNYEEAVKVNAALFNHTPQGATHYSTRLTGAENERYGLAKSLSVMPGDTIRIEVFAKYVDPDVANWEQALSDLMTSIANGTAPAGTVVDGGLPGSIGSANFPYGGVLTKSSGGVPPKAFLNYIMFDRDANPILDATQTNFKQVSTQAKENGTNGNHERLYAEVIAKQPGLMYIYLSNDNVELGGSPVEVFFDDFRVEHVKSPVIQADNYYPFGLTFNSYQKESSVFNRFQYNGIERINNLGLDWYQAKYRTLDPSVGRWIQIDPKVDNFYDWTPYNSNLNNPLLHSDPRGDCPPGTPGCDVLVDAAIAIGGWLNEPISGDAQAIGQAYMISSTGVDAKPQVRWQLLLAIAGQASQHGVKPGRYNLKAPAATPRTLSSKKVTGPKKVTDPRFATRPKFKKQTEQEAVKRATDENGTLKCTKCDKELTGEKQENGKRDFQLAHPEEGPWVQQQDNWQKKADDNVDFSRGDVSNQYQKDVEVQCVNCNASDGGRLGAARKREKNQ